jgi:hypothetical protein
VTSCILEIQIVCQPQIIALDHNPPQATIAHHKKGAMSSSPYSSPSSRYFMSEEPPSTTASSPPPEDVEGKGEQVESFRNSIVTAY